MDDFPFPPGTGAPKACVNEHITRNVFIDEECIWQEVSKLRPDMIRASLPPPPMRTTAVDSTRDHIRMHTSYRDLTVPRNDMVRCRKKTRALVPPILQGALALSVDSILLGASGTVVIGVAKRW